MSHPDQDLLADVALGESVPGDVRAHIADCTTCAAEIDSLRSTLSALRQPQPNLVTAPAAVWDRVLSTMDEGAALSAQPLGPAPSAAQPMGQAPAEDAPAAARPDVPDVSPAGGHDELAARRSGAGRRRVGLGWVAGAAAAGLVFGVVGARVLTGEEATAPAITVASTSLDTLDTLEALGTADLNREDGRTDLVVRTDPIDADDGYLEVWLINRDLQRMVSVGVMDPAEGDQSFPVTQELIDQGYVIVDISREGFDDKPQHSGDSVVRGTLPA